METKRYRISEMAKEVGVENHVLRYWEEELELEIKRNEMGHRYYTPEDVRLYKKIKEWKDGGVQLKGIKNLLIAESEKETGLMVQKNYELEGAEAFEDKEQKSLRLQFLLKQLVQDAVTESNQQLLMDMKDVLVKEMDFQFRKVADEQERQHIEFLSQQEDYFNQLDQMIQKDLNIRKKKGILAFRK